MVPRGRERERVRPLDHGRPLVEQLDHEAAARELARALRTKTDFIADA